MARPVELGSGFSCTAFVTAWTTKSDEVVNVQIEERQNGYDYNVKAAVAISIPSAFISYFVPAVLSIATYSPVGPCDETGLYLALNPPCPGVKWRMSVVPPTFPPTPTPAAIFRYGPSEIGVAQLAETTYTYMDSQNKTRITSTCGAFWEDTNVFYNNYVVSNPQPSPFALPTGSAGPALTGYGPGVQLDHTQYVNEQFSDISRLLSVQIW
jgi:hypothetical protein